MVVEGVAVKSILGKSDGSLDGRTGTDVGLAVSSGSIGALLPTSSCSVGELVTASSIPCTERTGAVVASNTGMVGDKVMKGALVGVEDGKSVEGAAVNGNDDD